MSEDNLTHHLHQGRTGNMVCKYCGRMNADTSERCEERAFQEGAGHGFKAGDKVQAIIPDHHTRKPGAPGVVAWTRATEVAVRFGTAAPVVFRPEHIEKVPPSLADVAGAHRNDASNSWWGARL